MRPNPPSQYVPPMVARMVTHLCWIGIASFALRALAEPRPGLAEYIGDHELEDDIKAFCLKQPTLDTPAETEVLESTTRLSHGFRFESIRFSAAREGAGRSPACTGEREIILAFDSENRMSKLFDSGFHPEAYCEDPFRYWQPPIVYDLRDSNLGKFERELAVVEVESSALPCPDIEDFKARRYLFFDLEDSNKLFLDVQADFVVPDAGIGGPPLRLYLFNVSKVLRSSSKIRANQIPDAIEFTDGSFSVRVTTTDEQYFPPETENDEERVTLDSIYSRDQKHVYIDTVDESGIIQGADPNSFRLLSTDDESAYTKDANTVFFFGEAIPSADAKTFIQLNPRYGKDIRRAYFMDSPIPEADVSSFVAPFKSVWYAKDKNHVFSGSDIFWQADPLTFSTGEDRSCGKNCTYRTEDKNYRFDIEDRIVQKAVPATESK